MAMLVIMPVVVMVVPVVGPVFFACVTHTKQPPNIGQESITKNQKITPIFKILF
jgi:hypothetical protein